MESIYSKLRENHFEVFHEVKKILTREEILNLFYNHRNASFFPDIEELMLTSESIVLLLVNACESIPAEDERDEDITLQSPVLRWKKLLGSRTPEEAKGENAESLRALFGQDEIKNGFYGSDDAMAANKERDIFLFPIPERPPVFEYVRTKLTMDLILSFCFPPNLEHANSTGRLDLIALYGPIVKYHSVDYCFCKNCVRIAKDKLLITIGEKEAIERKKMGITANSTGGLGSTGPQVNLRGPNAQKVVLTVRKVSDAPIRLLKEKDIMEIEQSLCQKCRTHCD